jgi:hypothetical protein
VDDLGPRGQLAFVGRHRAQEVDLQVEACEGKPRRGRRLDRNQHREIGQHRDCAAL